MLISYRWLTELLPQLGHSADEVGKVLSGVGLAVDGGSDHESALRPVILAQVLKIDPHPEREQLQLVTIRTRSSQRVAPLGGSQPPSSVTGNYPD
ncbi:MAG: hypothetical protein MK135_03285, partial [Polyangiaceae bacterium]|nr:hypothetical protein [Polyangiaceae bacterium]